MSCSSKVTLILDSKDMHRSEMSLRNYLAVTGVLIVCCTSTFYGFIVDIQSDPCLYYVSEIYCKDRNLTSIPVFNLTSYTHVCFNSINLESNKLTSIGKDAFIQLSSLNCSYSIKLGNNNMSQINEYAFKGIEAHIDTLSLDTNNLHSLPEALGAINLKRLFIIGNPIVSLNPSVMAKIGRSVTFFGVSMASFQQWPSELRFLYELRELLLYDIPFQSLDSDAFLGLTHVRDLTIKHSNFKKFPDAVCSLSAVKSLRITENYYFNESKSDVFKPCSNITGTPNVESITYSYNRVDYFPNICAMFPNVKWINMESNGMRFMDGDKFENNFSVGSLFLADNQFRRIPSGINIFKSLASLNLGKNLLESIEDNDLIGLRSLIRIDLDHNPIQFITNKAFQNNMNILYLSLAFTSLTTIPVAITMLPALQNLHLEVNDIECTCELASLKSWNVSNVQIDGLCYQTNERIEKFIKTYIDAGKC